MEQQLPKVIFHLEHTAYAGFQQQTKETGAQSVGDFLLDAINFDLETAGLETFPPSSYKPHDPVLEVRIDEEGLRRLVYKIEIDFQDGFGERIHDLAIENHGMTRWIGRALIGYIFFIQEGSEARERAMSAWFVSPASPS